MRTIMAVLVGSMLVAAPAFAQEYTLALTANELALQTDAATAEQYYVLQVSVPAQVATQHIIRAFLEFHADVSAVAVNNWTNDVPLVEAYVLGSPVGQALNVESLQKPSPMIRGVPAGENRRVRLDVTDAMRFFAENPQQNHGIVIGSFRGAKEGRIAIRAEASGAMGRIVFFTE